jgi:glycosyltransferase involved in cell wall biosynthesis
MSTTRPTNTPLVSVVTPVHNDAEYIQECIESVQRQTYANWDYTVIDNASTDETSDIVARLASLDSRVRHVRFEQLVDTTENHNRAFRSIAAESEFCKVVQADDWLYPECLQRMVQVAQSTDSIGLVSAYRLWGTEVDLDGLPHTMTVVNGRKILRQCLLGGPYVTGAPTAVLYRSSLVREQNPFYEGGFEHADTEAAYRLLSRHDFAFVHQVLTFARRQAGARMQWADEMNTYGPENIRFLLRYGREALEPSLYRRQLRRELGKYISFHARQFPKPSRLSDGRFFALHESEIEAILDEAGRDREVRAAMLVVRTMLLRGAGRAAPHTAIR